METTHHFVRKFKLPLAGEHLQYLQSEATVVNQLSAPDGENVFVTVILTESVMKKFESRFGTVKKVVKQAQ